MRTLLLTFVVLGILLSIALIGFGAWTLIEGLVLLRRWWYFYQYANVGTKSVFLVHLWFLNQVIYCLHLAGWLKLTFDII